MSAIKIISFKYWKKYIWTESKREVGGNYYTFKIKCRTENQVSASNRAL